MDLALACHPDRSLFGSCFGAWPVIAKGGPEDGPTRAAEYVRMSKDLQCYSIENQRLAIAAYAAERGIEIVRTFSDEGKSGLRLEGRAALQALITEVQAGAVDFQVLLVYDVSRWGRFQDADESAYYEHLCRRNGVPIIYCAEPFENDGSPLSALYKSMKRTMAGEYSRELSIKVRAGQRRLASQGYRQGGICGYGLRRLLLDQHGNPKAILKPGDRKSLLAERVILVPGPPEEVDVVRRIYDLFIDQQVSVLGIARLFNSEGLKTELDQPWTDMLVREILRNEKYIGNVVYCRLLKTLNQRPVNNAPTDWIRVENAFEGIIEPSRFAKAQRRFADRTWTTPELLRLLRKLLAREGRLSSRMITEAKGYPSATAYIARFGGMLEAYAEIGYEPEARAVRCARFWADRRA